MNRIALVAYALWFVAVITAKAQSDAYERHIGVLRGYYDDVLTNEVIYSRGRPYHRYLADAVRGDDAAAHRLFHSEYRGQMGEFGGTWDTHCWVLLLKVGDVRFHKLLAREDRKTRKLVGLAIPSDLDAEFPKTAGLVRAKSR